MLCSGAFSTTLASQFRSALYRFLADRCRLIRYDGRGNGFSDRYVPEISFAAFEHDLEAVIDALRLQRYALLGIKSIRVQDRRLV